MSTPSIDINHFVPRLHANSASVYFTAAGIAQLAPLIAAFEAEGIKLDYNSSKESMGAVLTVSGYDLLHSKVFEPQLPKAMHHAFFVADQDVWRNIEAVKVTTKSTQNGLVFFFKGKSEDIKSLEQALAKVGIQTQALSAGTELQVGSAFSSRMFHYLPQIDEQRELKLLSYITWPEPVHVPSAAQHGGDGFVILLKINPDMREEVIGMLGRQGIQQASLVADPQGGQFVQIPEAINHAVLKALHEKLDALKPGSRASHISLAASHAEGVKERTGSGGVDIEL